MAGTAENIQVVSSPKNVSVFDGELSPTDLNFNTTDSVSLQDMIDSELALRIVNGLQKDQEEDIGVSEDVKSDTLVDLSPIRHPKHMIDITPVYETPSEQFIEGERLHTMATLNVFSDTIDLSPDCEQAPAFLQSPDISPQYENVPFDPADDGQQSSPISPTSPHIPSEPDMSPLYENVSFKTSDFEELVGAKNILVKLDSEESPVTEDASDLEPMPLFTQTISSDHEQSPLTEVNPFVPDEIAFLENGSPVLTPIEIHPVVNVHIEPPDTSPLYSDDSPEQTVKQIETVEPEPIVENEPEPLIETEPEPLVKTESQSLVEIGNTSPVACIDSVDASVDVANRMREFGVASVTVSVPQWKTAAESEAEWTTVEDATKSEESNEESPIVEESPSLHNSVSETITTSTTTKTVKKKKSVENGESTKTKKTKKTKKSEEKENHISVKSSFSKFDQLQKKTVLHVRSSDASKIQKQLNQETPEALGGNPTCKSCSKTVFAMEQVKAERSVWHKNCFRCKECSKQLTMDTYQSHEGELYCKPHFKELFKPKAVVDNTEDEPPSDKADLGLEELSALNVKARFQVFEKTGDGLELEKSPSTVNVKRSPSILSKLAKFQKKGMDVGVTDDILNGVDYEESSSSEEEGEGEEGQVVKSSKRPERPVSFNKMEDVKRSWETSSGSAKTKEEMRAEHKKEISQIRSRLFQGKQGKMKEMYEQAVADSEGKLSCKKDQDIVMSEKARLIKERFERGEVVHSGSEDEDDKKNKNREADDLSVFEAGISKKSRSLFLELDASAAKTSSPVTPPVHALTPKVSERKAPQEPSPEQEIYRDPSVVRSEDTAEDENIVKRSQTASRMLSLFRQMEEQKESVPEGLKPLKCFTPPPDYKEGQTESSEEEEEESEEEQDSEEDGIIRSSDKIEDESLKQAQSAARAKALREKFEHWEPEKQSVNNAINMLESEQESIESTKSLRARFESLKSDQPKEKKSAPKVNRFVETPTVVIKCLSCDKTVYPLEKVEVDGRIYHANCFRCQQCQCKLRMETYTLNNENLYCLPHFRQLFIAKGNYDEGFGSNQHKSKWENTTTTPPAITNDVTTTVNGH